MTSSARHPGPVENIGNSQAFDDGNERRLHEPALSARIAHDMHTPLAVIATTTELLAEPLDDGERNHLLNILRRQTRKLERMVEDLLDYSCLPLTGCDLRPEWIRLESLVQEGVGDFRWFTRSHELALELNGALPLVFADSAKIQRILQNLLDNAVCYSPPGTTITVRLSAAPDSAHVVLDVADQGCGLSEDDQLRVFDALTRLDPTNGRGHGLGLYIVRCLAEAHGGSVWIEPASGPGTCFRVCLPVHGPVRSQATQIG